MATPSISSITPGSGYTGQLLTVTGTNFTPSIGGNSVTLNGNYGQLVIVGTPTNTSMVIQIQSSAPLGSGLVQIGNGSALSNTYSITVTAFGPTVTPGTYSGTQNGSINIPGTQFDSATIGNNIVQFQGPNGVLISGTVTAATSTQITVTVPIGALSGALVITIDGTAATGSALYSDTGQNALETGVNIPPTANAGGNYSGQVGVTLSLNGSASVANSGTLTSQGWVQISGPGSITFGTPTALNTTAFFTLPGTYVVELTVTDSNGAFNSQESTLVIAPASSIINPTVNAGLNQILVLPNNSTTLQGTAQVGTGFTISSTKWTQLSGPSIANFSNNTILNPIVSGLITGVYLFTLTVIDVDTGSASANVTITVYAANSIGSPGITSNLSILYINQRNSFAYMISDFEGKGQFGWMNTNILKRISYCGVLIRVLDYQFSLPSTQQNAPYILAVSNYVTYLLGTYLIQGSIMAYSSSILPSGTNFNITGSNIPGPSGTPGSVITIITTLPNTTVGAATGRPIDFLLYSNVNDPTNNGKLYQNIGGTNTVVANLLGPQGNPGSAAGILNQTAKQTGASFNIDGTATIGLSSDDVSNMPTPLRILSSYTNTNSTNTSPVNSIFRMNQTVANAGTIQGLEGYVKLTHTTGTVAGSIGSIASLEIAGVGGTTTFASGFQASGIVTAGTVTQYAAFRATPLGISGTGIVSQIDAFYAESGAGGVRVVDASYFGAITATGNVQVSSTIALNANGQFRYNSVTNLFEFQQGGIVVGLGSGGSTYTAGNNIDITGTKPSLKIARTLYSNTFFSGYTDFTANGITPMIVNNQIQLTGAFSIGAAYLALNGQTHADEHQENEVIFNASTLGAGIGLGKISINTAYTVHLVGVVNTSTNTFTINYYNGSVWSVLSTASLAATTIVGDNIRVRFIQNEEVFTWIVENTTQKSYNYYTISSTLTNTTTINFVVPNTGNIAVVQIGGINLIKSFTSRSYGASNPNYLLVGDSKFSGIGTTSSKLRLQSLLSKLGYVETWAGPGDRTAEVLASINGIIALKPQNVILNIGRNDLAFGVASATWQANYASIVSQLTTAGINVIHLIGIDETTQSQTTLYSYITSTYSAAKIINILPGWSNANYLSVDNVHWNDYGTRYAASQILASSAVTIQSNYAYNINYQDYLINYSLSNNLNLTPNTIAVGGSTGSLANSVFSSNNVSGTPASKYQILNIGLTNQISFFAETTGISNIGFNFDANAGFTNTFAHETGYSSYFTYNKSNGILAFKSSSISNTAGSTFTTPNVLQFDASGNLSTTGNISAVNATITGTISASGGTINTPSNITSQGNLTLNKTTTGTATSTPTLISMDASYGNNAIGLNYKFLLYNDGTAAGKAGIGFSATGGMEFVSTNNVAFNFYNLNAAGTLGIKVFGIDISGNATSTGYISSKGNIKNLITKTTNYTVTLNDDVIYCGAGTYTITLPNPTTNSGQVFYIIQTSTGTVTINATGGGTVIPNASQTLATSQTLGALGASYSKVTLQSNGTNYLCLASI